MPSLSSIAQLVEQMTVNHRVAGSSPAWGAIEIEGVSWNKLRASDKSS